MADDDHNETFDELTINAKLIDPSGTEHTGEISGSGGSLTFTDSDGNVLVEDATAVTPGDYLTAVDNGDGTVTLHAENTDTNTHVTVENTDGNALVQNVARIQAGDGLEFADDGDGTVTLNYTGDTSDGGGGDGSLSSTLYEDFESSDYEFWTSVYRDANLNRVQAPAHEGSYSLQTFYPSGSQYGATVTYEPVAAGDTDSAYTEMFTRYYVYFPSDFSFENQRSKLPGPWSTKGDPSAGTASDGTNGWSARGSYGAGSTSGTVRFGYYTYYMDMSGGYGNYFGFNQDYATDTWHRIDQHVKKNTISNGTANYDGEMHMWVNGEQTVNETSMRFSEDTSTGIDFRLAFFFGGDNPAPSDQSLYTDNYRVDNTDFAGMH